MNRFSTYVVLLLVALSTLVTSCSDDEIRASLTISQTAIYFSELGEKATISYSGSNINHISFDESDLPAGWNIYISRGNKTITVEGPTSLSEFEESLTSTTISFVATSVDDLTAYDYLTIGTTGSSVDLSDMQANSFIVSKPNTIYSFNATYKGEEQESISPSSVKILWQTYPQPISFARMVGDKVEFHVAIDKDDKDEDDSTSDLMEGNALIAAYNSKGEVIWSWHIWVSDFSADDSAEVLNGATIMSRNLGARDNATESEDDILNSYGLYYQWGRKDPFITPAKYNASYGTDASLFNESGTIVYVSYKESTSSIGNESYAVKNPMTYILGTEKSGYDWLYSEHNNTLWSETKSINDPCPKGWRVASPATFANLEIPTMSQEDHEALYNAYGWDLSDASGNKSLFMGLGRRGYITGKIQNVNLNAERPAPWAGYYWSYAADAADQTKAEALYFSYDKTSPADNTIENSAYYRSNGMQIRCQRDE